jgi:lactate dehydrogenase-like 2-hydroxyacid dehydrogenase
LSVFIQSCLDEKALSRVPNLKLIATRSTGYDHIDLAWCRSRGITVSNVPVYGHNTVAEHTFALLLALSRKVIQSHNRGRTGNFSLAGLQGFDLRGKTLGLPGLDTSVSMSSAIPLAGVLLIRRRSWQHWSHASAVARALTFSKAKR